MKASTTKKIASTQFAPIISDKEVRAIREQTILKNTRKMTNWATTVWIDWKDKRGALQKKIHNDLIDLAIHLMNN